MLFERLHETTHNNLLCRNTKRLSFGCAECEWDAVPVLYELRMTIHMDKVMANQATHTRNRRWCLCHPGKKTRAVFRHFFFSTSHTNLSRIKSNAKCIYIYPSIRDDGFVRGSDCIKHAPCICCWKPFLWFVEEMVSRQSGLRTTGPPQQQLHDMQYSRVDVDAPLAFDFNF